METNIELHFSTYHNYVSHIWLCLHLNNTGLFHLFHGRFAGLKITAGHRTMTGQKCHLTGHFFTSPVILTGHICMPSDRILNRFFSSTYLLKSCQRKTVYLMASTQFHCKYVKLRTTKTLFVLVIYNVIANVLSV